MKPAMRAYITANQPCTAQQVVDAIGCTRQAVTHRHQMGEIYISHWRRDLWHRRFVAHYSLGNEPDADRPSRTELSHVATQWVGGKYPGAQS